MKNRIAKMFPLLLAALLQIMPLARTAVVATGGALSPSGWAVVFRWVVGTVGLLGFDAISSASSIAISPPNAIVGKPYVGTITYSGGHAGAVSSMSLTNICLGSEVEIAPGLTAIYNGGNTATVSGTPTTAGNFSFTLKMFDASGCGGGGNTDTRSATLVVSAAGAGGTPPSITAPPQSITAQVGADALLSAGASGNPTPNYYWYLGLPSANSLISTNSTVNLSNVQYANAGLYTVVASNASGTASATAFLSVALTPGSNQLALNYTNYYPVGHALTMYSLITNAPAASNVYKWQYNFVDITPFSTTGENLNLSAAQVAGAKSGTYSVVFNSVVGGNTIVNQQAYYAFWSFGSPPSMITPPSGTNIASGSSVTFNVSAGGSNTLYYQWVFNGTNALPAQTNASLTLNAVTADADGSYAVVVTNYWGAITSAPAVLTVSSAGSAPVITSQPAPRSILVGQSASFTVAASGTPPLSYQWFKGSQSLINGGIYLGVTSNVLTLTGAGLGDAGNYSVTVSNSSGATNSNAAMLAVSAPPVLSITPGLGGALQLSATAPPGLVYLTQTATNLSSPWLSIGSNVVPVSGVIVFTNVLTNLSQFFRLAFP